jgi:hypothetical protein
MTEQLVRGDVLRSPVSDARFLVIAAGRATGMPSLDGVPTVRGTLQPCGAAGDTHAGGELRGGRRYRDVVTGLTLLCIRPGAGSLRYEGRPLIPETNDRTRLPVPASRA